MPDTLSPQVPIIEAVLDAVGIARVGVERYEADDVIGTYTAHAKGPVDIVTGDRDLYQLVDDARGVRVLYPLKGVGSLQVTDEAFLREKYGVDGRGYVDLALLRGDPSDGLPGVPGIGEKTAAKLLAEFGDVPGIMAAIDDPKSKLTPSQRKRLDESRPYVAVAPKVVRVADDVPLPDVDPTLPHAPRDPDLVVGALAERWGWADHCSDCSPRWARKHGSCPFFLAFHRECSANLGKPKHGDLGGRHGRTSGTEAA